MSHLQSIMGVLAGGLSILCVIPYIISTLQGDTQPHRVTWWILSMLGFLMSANHFAAGGTTTVWEPLCAAIGQLCIALLSIRYGKGGWSKLDCTCLAGAGLSLILWQQLASPLLALVVNIAVDFLACLPTIRKALQAPESEDFLCWMLYCLSSGCNLFAVQHWSIDQAALPLYLFIGNGLILSLLVGNQVRLWKTQYRFVRGVSLYQYDQVVLCHLTGPMILSRARDIERQRASLPTASRLVLDCTKSTLIGFRAACAIIGMLRDAHQQGMEVYLVGVTPRLRRHFLRLGVADVVQPQHMVHDAAHALQGVFSHFAEGPQYPARVSSLTI